MSFATLFFLLLALSTIIVIILSTRLTGLRAKLQSVVEELGSARSALARTQSDRERLLTSAAVAAAQVESQAQQIKNQKALVEETRALIRTEVKSVSAEALMNNSASYAELTEAHLKTIVERFEGGDSARRLKVEKLIEPLGKALGELTVLVTEGQGSYSKMGERLDALRNAQVRVEQTATSLANALRSPQARGRWGEMHLRRTVELAGLTERCDFETEVTVPLPDGHQRPDLVVSLPGGKHIIVDSKVPLTAFMDAEESGTDEEREACLERHADLVKTHIKGLSKKGYQRHFEPSPDFVVMFIPGEAFYHAALQRDSALVEMAAKANVMIATPMSLIAMLRIIAQGWADVELAENAQRIRSKGKDLYDRLRIYADHVSSVGTHLERATKKFNQAASSFETRLLPAARDLAAMDCRGAKIVKTPPQLTISTTSVATYPGTEPPSGDGSATTPPELGVSPDA